MKFFLNFSYFLLEKGSSKFSLRDILVKKYSDTSANEDNSFWDHIR
jgi:hypothetical protein